MAESTSQNRSIIPPYWIITLIATALLVWLVYELQEIAILFIVGYCIAYICDPILNYLETKKISRSIGVILIIVGLALFITVLTLTAIPTIAEQYDNLSANLPQYIQTLKERFGPEVSKILNLIPGGAEAAPPPTGESASQEQITGLVSNINTDTFKTILSGLAATLLKGYSFTVALVNLALLPFIVFYLAVDFAGIRKTVYALIPKKYNKKVREILSEINTYVAAFVRGQLLVCLILTFLYAAGLALVGIDLWLLVGVVSGMGAIVPYFGFLIGIVLGSIMSLATYGDFYHLGMVWIVFMVAQALESFWITPTIMGNSVGMSPLSVIIAIFAGGQLFGLLGVFLAVPGAAILKVLGRHFHTWLMARAA